MSEKISVKKIVLKSTTSMIKTNFGAKYFKTQMSIFTSDGRTMNRVDMVPAVNIHSLSLEPIDYIYTSIHMHVSMRLDTIN
jgi:hypothetical protein